MKSKLTNYSAWNTLDEFFRQIDVQILARKHLEEGQYTIKGYYHDDNQFYETVKFTTPLELKLNSFSMGQTVDDGSHWIRLRFFIRADLSSSAQDVEYDEDKELGDLTLIFDDQGQFIDENWFIDVYSPFIAAKRGM